MDRRSYLGTALTGVLSALSGCLVRGLDVAGATSTSTPVVDRTASVDGDVTQYQADPANTGVHADTGPTDEVTALWRRTPGRYDDSQPVVVGGSVLVTFGGQLVALDRDTGRLRWRTDVGHDAATAPAVHAGTAYATSWNGTPDADRGLVAVDLASGDVLWRGVPELDVGTAPTATPDGVFVGAGYDNWTVAAFDHDGTERWRRDLGEYASTPAVVDGTAYYGAGTATVVALDTATGDRNWRRSTDGAVTAAPTIAGDSVFAGSRGGTLYALSAADGTVRFSVDVGAPVRQSPANTGDTLVVPTDEGLVALDLGGTERWRVDHLERATAPAIAGDSVYVGAGRTLHAVALADGRSRWSFVTRERTYTDVVLGGIRGGPAVTGETIFVGTQVGDVYALGTR